MGLQKYRADEFGDKQKNGAIPAYAKWMGGPTLSIIRDCPIENGNIAARTVYITGDPDTFFSIPAACRYKGKTIRGYVTTNEDREYVFMVNNSSAIHLPSAS